MGKLLLSIIVCCAAMAFPPLGLLLLWATGVWED